MGEPSPKTCSIAGCDRPCMARGWCNVHYGRWRKTNDPLGVRPGRWAGYEKPPCSVAGCERVVIAKGMCPLHYGRTNRTGEPGGVALSRVYGDVLTRWWAKVDKNGPIPQYAPHLGNCYSWLGKPNDEGYGHLKIDGKNRPAHRVGYELLVGPIPDGLQLDHLCRNRICVRPSHLEPVTQKVNGLRGFGYMAIQARKIECINGHPLVGPDARLYDYPGKGRQCVPCHNAKQRALYWKRKAEREAAANQ